MTAKSSTFKSNLRGIFYLSIFAAVVFSACFFSRSNKNNVLINSTMAWISGCINAGNGYDFVQTRAGEAFVRSRASMLIM